MSLATTIQRIAAQQGGKYGVPIVITRKVPGAGFPDPMTGAIAAATQTANGKAIVSPEEMRAPHRAACADQAIMRPII